MASDRSQGPGWIASVMGAALLVCTGFLLGLVVGVISEEPELVVGDLAGDSEEVEWAAQAVAESPASEVALGAAKAPVAKPSDEVVLGAARESASPAPVSAAPARTPAVSTPPRPTAGFAVQVGAFAESATAESIAADLRKNGFETYVTPGAGARDGRWRVRVGPVASREEAEQVAASLKAEEQLPTWILSEGRN